MTRTLLHDPLSYPNYVQSNDTLHWLAWRKFAQNLWRQWRIWITWQRVESKRSLDTQNTQKNINNHILSFSNWLKVRERPPSALQLPKSTVVPEP